MIIKLEIETQDLPNTMKAKDVHFWFKSILPFLGTVTKCEIIQEAKSKRVVKMEKFV